MGSKTAALGPESRVHVEHAWAEVGRLHPQLPPPPAQSTLRAQGIVKKAQEPRGGSVLRGRQSLSLRCCGMCLSVCVKGWEWVGAHQRMRLQICQSARVCVCVYVCVCVRWRLCGSHFLPLFSSFPVLPSYHFLSPGAIPVLSAHLIPGPPRTMTPPSSLFIPSSALRSASQSW